jgi:hypothetical protein
MFDRGEQVTECLWLLYKLEKEALLQGGKVHFILGNHELMNLSGDLRYVSKKYTENAKKMSLLYAHLYSSNSELGVWLRSKNIIEKIGNILFVHAGISREFNDLNLPLQKINEKAKPYYDKELNAGKITDTAINIIYSPETSPFWYRSYYQDKEVKTTSKGKTLYKTPEKVINETLLNFNVEHIVTGHTIVADTISAHYHNKVINIDTKHVDGKSEALFIEGSKFYRVNDRGQKWLLFDEAGKRKAEAHFTIP